MAQTIHVPNLPHIVEDRKMMSRTVQNQVQLVGLLEPGEWQTGCCVCCHAPAKCPGCAVLPCCGLPEYIHKEVEASKYIVLRENALEWNEPGITCREGWCCGYDPCMLRVRDEVHVLYYDDPSFDYVKDDTRCCNECRTFFCGGRGQTVRIDHRFCCGLCLYSNFGVCGIPICCLLIPMCKLLTEYHEIYVADAAKAVYDLKEARASAKTRLGVE